MYRRFDSVCACVRLRVCAPSSTTLYKAHVKPVLTTTFKGVNATIFAYDQISAGKSSTTGVPNR